ncbi:replication protein [Acinetobacter soli]|uniref:replication protein n=1 Tax=Acinetobacter soli TaxID=487316 RepID=UPI003AA9DA26
MSNFISNAFMLPNDLIDKGYMAKMKGAALACYLFIVRKTRGWNKSDDNISISQLAEATGYGKDAVLAGINVLIEMGIVEKISYQNRPSNYKLTDAVIAVGKSDSVNSTVGNTDTAVGNPDSKPKSAVGNTDGGVGNSDSNLSEIPTHKNNIKTTNTKTRVNGAKTTPTQPNFSAKKYLIEIGVTEQTANEYINLRTKKRKLITETVIKLVVKQAELAGITNDRAFQIITARGWDSFKADWNWQETNAQLDQLNQPVSHSEQPTPQQPERIQPQRVGYGQGLV